MSQRTTKVCSKCKKEKPLSEFHKNGRGGLRSVCKKCHSIEVCNFYKTPHGRKLRKKVSEKYRKSEKGKLVRIKSEKNWKLKRRAYELQRKYGLTTQDEEIFLTKQKNLCAICGLPNLMGKERLAPDHNHNTRKVRGYLCPKCNKALGLLKVDNFGTLNLEMAIKYLEKTQ